MTIRFIQSWNGYQPDQIVSGLTNEATIIAAGIARSDIDGDNDGEAGLAKWSTDANGNTVLLGPDGNPIYSTSRAGVGKMYAHPNSYVASSATTGGITQGGAYALPLPYDAVRIGYVHAGGNGAASGITALIAASDDLGSGDYADANTAAARKFITPLRAGTEYNSVTANGWHAVTWGGASSTGATDAGSNKISVTWSDVMQVESIVDANGYYPLLARVYPGAGPYSYGGGNLAGIQTGSRYNAGNAAKFLSASRTGDNVGTPANWGTGNTPTYQQSSLPLIIDAWSSSPASSALFVGDSRFESVSEAPYNTTHAFAGLPYQFQLASIAGGKPTLAMRAGHSGWTTSQALETGLAMLADTSPRVAFYLGYSVNDTGGHSSISSTALSTCKRNLLKFIDKCRTQGTVPIIIPAMPDISSWTSAAKLQLARDFVTWCRLTGYPVFDALTAYGDSSGIYLPAYNDGTLGSHMNQAGYAQFGADLFAFSRSYL